jgi:hypothetical protein
MTEKIQGWGGGCSGVPCVVGGGHKGLCFVIIRGMVCSSVYVTISEAQANSSAR